MLWSQHICLWLGGEGETIIGFSGLYLEDFKIDVNGQEWRNLIEGCPQQTTQEKKEGQRDTPQSI